jgi:glycerol-3-phosphate dehydrogenase (NAD(P)+)
MAESRIAVLGGGAWGSTLAQLAQQRGHRVQIWSRRQPDRLEPIVTDAEVIISAVAMRGVRSMAEQLAAIALPSDAILVSATKGLDSQSGSATQLPLRPSQIWQQALPNHSVVVLSGPNLAEEIQHGLPTATVVASTQLAVAEVIQTALSSTRFRIYTNPDSLGVELGGILKNVMAIAVGACDGLQLGTNAKAALVTRGLAEIIRIGLYWGANPDTFYGLSGLGDLMATCSGPLSRNYQVGYGLAQGQTLDQVLTQLQGTAEGVNTTQVLVQLASQQAIAVPISQQVHLLLNNQITPQRALQALMQRDQTSESEHETPNTNAQGVGGDGITL